MNQSCVPSQQADAFQPSASRANGKKKSHTKSANITEFKILRTFSDQGSR